MYKQIDKLIIGAGIYGLYAAKYSVEKGEKIVVLEYDNEAVSRATYINQARVHNGYHYPRSYSTAIKSANYFNRFNEDFSFAVNNSFNKIYATSKNYSWTSAEQFGKFCKAAHIDCNEINPKIYFKDNMVDGAFETKEYTFDAMIIKKYFLKALESYEKENKIDILYNSRIKNIFLDDRQKLYRVELHDGSIFETNYILNATYASSNQILDLMGFEKFKIKYELCEIIICNTSDNIRDVGITLMDGPFFSVMPFGLTGDHSLTSVTFTPHVTSYEPLPRFDCQKGTDCSPTQLANCNQCPHKPNTAWCYMHALSKKYLRDNIELYYKKSLFSMKPILLASEIDDSRPTLIKRFNDNPTFISVFSGKINTMYDLDEVL
ncbi:FAD-binding oxidoreductase [Paenibacillus thiaminolyticus]|uniref:FAD-dependent oxidoreductase n=1 Tax=Paenibacillus thiaminolyticus TaxID=49283 RepID=UPI002350FAE5|nr:FAD-dependent oxidoreductase [Paenibacillus thiaminolyticus]WCR26289.1 FAD-binding oxidoreductase [Paenibacillus thiaminolyticus]